METKVLSSDAGDAPSTPADRHDGCLSVETADTEVYADQVAGHSSHGDIVLLKHKDGFVMKPCQHGARGIRELEFYRRVYQNTKSPRSTALLFQNVTPTFHGVSTVVTNGVKQDYLMLQNATAGMIRPCVLDLKIGPVTWGPEASPAKIHKEKEKYKGTKGHLGISLAGMSHFDLKRNESVKKDRHFGKTLTETTLTGAIKEFLNYDCAGSSTISHKILKRLCEIEEVLLTQGDFSFYSSSILITYDAVLLSELRQGMDSPGDVDGLVRVFMIDFAHTYPMLTGLTRDDNYLFGLSNVIRIFRALLD